MLKERRNMPWRLRRTKEGVQRHMCAIVHFWSCLLLDTLMNFPIWKFALFFAPKHWKRPRSVGSRIPAQWIFMQEILQQNSDSPSHIFVKQDEMYEEYLKYPHTWRDVLQQENTSPKFELHVELAKALLDLSVSLPRTGYADVALGGDHCGYRSCFGGGNGVASRGLTTSMAYGLIQCPIFRKDPWHCTNQVTQQCLWMSLKHISTDVEHLDIHRIIEILRREHIA